MKCKVLKPEQKSAIKNFIVQASGKYDDVLTFSEYVKNSLKNPLLSKETVIRSLTNSGIRSYLNLNDTQKAVIRSVINNIDKITEHKSNTIINDSRAKFTGEGYEIPMFGRTLNKYLKENLYLEPFKGFIYDVNATNKEKVKFSLDSNGSVRSYKNSLYTIVSNFLADQGLNYPSRDLYNEDGEVINPIEYEKTLKTIWEWIVNATKNGALDSSVLDPTVLKIYNAVKAFYILNNFDDFVSNVGGDYIAVSLDNYNSLDVTDQYVYTDQGMAFVRWNSSDIDHDSQKNMNKSFYSFLQTVSTFQGKTWTKQDFSRFAEHFWNNITPEMITHLENNNINSFLDDLLAASSKIGRAIDRSNGDYMITSLVKALKDNLKVLDSLRDNEHSVEEVNKINHICNFANALKQELNNHNPKAYLQSSDEGFDIKSDASLKKAKTSVIQRLLITINNNIRNRNFRLYDDIDWLIRNADIDYNNSSFKARFKNMTGFDMTDDFIAKLSNNPGNKEYLFQFLIDLSIATREAYIESEGGLKNLLECINDELSYLKYSPAYIEISSLIVSDNFQDTVKILDQSDNQQPITTNSTLFLDFERNREKYIKEHLLIPDNNDDYQTNNILVKYRNLTRPINAIGKMNGFVQHAMTRKDVSYKTNDDELKVIEAIKLTPSQNLYVALNNEFVQPLVELDMMFNQVTCTSNKVSIQVGGINLKDHQLHHMSVEALNKMWYNQHKEYYDNVKKRIISDYAKLFANDSQAQALGLNQNSDLDGWLKFLENKKLIDLIQARINYNNSHPNDQVQLFKELHYTGDKLDKPFRFNPALYCSFNETITKKLYDEGEKLFYAEFSHIQKPKWLNKEYVDKNIHALAGLFGANTEQLDTLKEYLTDELNPYWVTDKEEYKSFVSNLEGKFYALSNLFKDADMFLTTGPSDILETKGLGSKYEPSVTQLLNDANDIQGDKINNITLFLLHGAYAQKEPTAAKRGNSFNGPVLRQQIGVHAGVGKTLRIMVVEKLRSNVHTYDGNSHSFDCNDGMLMTLGIASHWESYSYPGYNFGETKKVFGVQTELGTSTQYKCADFVINNAMLRDSFKDENTAESAESPMNLRNRVIKMMSAGVFTPNMFINLLERLKSGQGIVNLGFTINRRLDDGNIYQLQFENTEIIQKDGETLLVFTWENVITHEIKQISYSIKNVWELYEALGAENSLDFKDGEYVPSETSQKFIANFISEFDPSVKETIISKMADATAIKSGLGNLVTRENADSITGEVDAITVDSTSFGIQNDQSHESDEDTVPSLTQLIQDIALNGQNVEVVREMLATMKYMLNKELAKLSKPWDDVTKLQLLTITLTKELYKSLQKNVAYASDAQDIALKVLNEVDKVGGMHDLPISSMQLFRKICSNVIVDLNKKVLRKRFPGTAIVNNPSHGIIGLYEDNDGNVYKQTDFDKMSQDEKEIMFAPKEVAVEELNLEDVIETNFDFKAYFAEPEKAKKENREIRPITDFVKDGPRAYRITSPQELYALAKYIETSGATTVKKVFGYKRNLKPPSITWLELDEFGNRTIHNMWFTEACQKRLDPTLDPVIKRQYTDMYRANLQGLSEGFYYKTLDDYKAGIITKIVPGSLNYTCGEQILPKKYKTVLELGDASMQDIMKEGIMFFAGKAQRSLLKINQYKIESNALAALTFVRSNDEILVEQLPSNESIPSDIHVRQNENEQDYFYYEDDYGNELFRLPSLDCKVTVLEDHGKKIYKVITTSDVRDAYNVLTDVNAIYESPVLDKSGNEIYKLEKWVRKHNKNIDTYVAKEELGNQVRNYAEKLFQSFKIYNETVSTRIPTQAFLSFMANKTVAFTESDLNDGYVNSYMVFFQGADFDIDKSYTLMFGEEKDGTIATISPLVSLDSFESYRQGMLKLPLPNSKLIIKEGKDFNHDNFIRRHLLSNIKPIFEKYGFVYSNGDLSAELELYYSNVKSNNDYTKIYGIIKDLNSFIEGINQEQELIIEYDEFNFIDYLNLHNSFKVSDNGYKNKITASVWECAHSIKNLEASLVPMDSKPITDLIDEVENEEITLVLNKKSSTVYNPYNPMTKWYIQFQAKTGNETTGIAANALKTSAACQQHYNEVYADWDGDLDHLSIDNRLGSYIVDNGQSTFKDGINLNISIGEEDNPLRTIIRKDIVKFGDVNLGANASAKYQELHKNTDVTKWLDYQIINAMYTKNFSKTLDTLPENESWLYNSMYYKKGDHYELRSHIAELQEVLRTYLSYHPETNLSAKSDFLNFMQYAENHRMKVADSVSIFISLAVDNMKELALARMNADADFLGMALSMLSLGVEPRDVIDICINVLDPIFQARLANVLLNETQELVRELIAKSKVLNDSTKRSLIQVYDYAQDMRLLSDFFKVNQGVTATYTTLITFINRLSHNKAVQEKNKGINVTKGDDKSKYIIKFLENNSQFKNKYKDTNNLDITQTEEYLWLYKDLNFKELFSNSEYQSLIIEYYNTLKTVFNPISVIVNNPNYNTMLQGLSITTSLITKMAGVSRFINMCKQIIPADKYMHESDINKLIRIYDNFIIGELIEDLNFSFSINGLRRSGLQYNDHTIAPNSKINLASNTGIQVFMDLMNNTIIPNLRQQYSHLLFFNDLIEKHNNYKDRNYWTLPFDGFNDTDIVSRKQIEGCISSLLQVANMPSGFSVDVYGNLTIGEALLLYQLIETNGNLSSMTTVVSAVTRDSALARRYFDKISEWDKALRVNHGDNVNANRLAEELLPIAKAVLYNKGDLNNVSINKLYLLKFQPIKSKLKDILDVNNLNVEDVYLDKRSDGNHILIKIGDITIDLVLLSMEQGATLDNLEIDINSAINLLKAITNNKELLTLRDGNIATLLTKDKVPFLNRRSILNTLFKDTDIEFYEITINNPLMYTSRGYVEREGNKTRIYLNKELRSLNQYKEYDILNLILDSTPDLITSALKIEYLKNALNIPNDTNTKNNARNIEYYKGFIEYLSDNRPYKEETDKILSILKDFQVYLDDVNIYYKTVNRKSLKEGDLVGIAASYNPTHMYLGLLNNQDIFISLENLEIIKGNRNFVAKKSLRVPAYTTYPQTNFKSIQGLLFLETGPLLSKEQLFNAATYNTMIKFKNQAYCVSQRLDDSIILQDFSGKFILVNKNRFMNFAQGYWKSRDTSIATSYNTVQISDDFPDMKKTVLQKLVVGTKIDRGDKTYSVEGIGDLITLRDQSLIDDLENRDTYVSKDELLYDGDKVSIPGANNFIDSEFINDIDRPSVKFTVTLVFREDSKHNLYGYTEVLENNIANLQVGDLIKKEEKNNVVWYKVIGKSLNNYLVQKQEQGIDKKFNYLKNTMSIEILPISTTFTKVLSIKRYTKNPIASRPKVESSTVNVTNIKALNKLVLEYLQNKLGITVELDDNIQNGDIRIEDNVIIMNTHDFESGFVQYAAHELSHLVLTYLKIHNPDAYYTLVGKALSLLSSYEQGRTEVSSIIEDKKVYVTEDQKVEEMLVRYLDLIRSEIMKNKSVSLDAQGFIDLMNEGFAALFEVVNTNHEASSNSLATILDTKNFFTLFSEEMHFTELLKSTKLNQITSEILKKCD